jgi:hypothetical protein
MLIHIRISSFHVRIIMHITCHTNWTKQTSMDLNFISFTTSNKELTCKLRCRQKIMQLTNHETRLKYHENDIFLKILASLTILQHIPFNTVNWRYALSSDDASSLSYHIAAKYKPFSLLFYKHTIIGTIVSKTKESYS